MNPAILIADDEERWRRIVGDFLRTEGYRVLEAADGLQALELLSREEVDLVVLDIMMPHLDGLETCRRIRQSSTVPVMIVTAREGEEAELGGFACGADDFVSKPLRFPVFMARIKALLKRSCSTVTTLQVGELSIDPGAHTARAAGQTLSLTPREYELLLYLMQHRDSVQTRQQILQHVWKIDTWGDARSVDTHVKNLRMKLGSCGRQLKTIRGSGYLLTGE